MNFVHISLSVHFVWLVWLSLQYYDHDAAISRIMGLVLPSDNVVRADDSGVLDDVDDLDSSLASREERLQLHDSDSVVHMHSKDLVTVETEIPSNKRHHISGNIKKRSSSSSEVILKRRSMLKNDNKSAGDFSRRLVQNSNENNVETKCFLTSYDNSTFVHTFEQNEILNETATFTLDFDLTTDLYASESSWSLVNQAEDNKLIIDFGADNIKLSPNTLQKFKYSCFVTLEESEGSTSYADSKNENKNKTCYTFTLSDSWGDGICCWGGLGFYSLKLNENIQLDSGRTYAHEVQTKFCMKENEYIPDVDINKLLYPSRECIGEVCYCDSKPKLLSNFDNIESRYSILRELKMRIFTNIVTLSGTGSLKDTSSPQYMAACWTLNDDPYLTLYESITTEELDAETRIIQRYILAVLYFATKPQNWLYDMNFLSFKSECEWSTLDGDGETMGMLCDEKNNIISVLFEKINIEGPLVDELSGLKSLEFMAFVKEPKLSGSIPPSFGLLSELRYLNLEDVSLISTIPPELFNARKMERLMIVGTSITGTIPENISNFNSLQILRLRENYLTGEIPEELYSLTQLRQLFLYDNYLSSTISSLIGNLNKLNRLRLNHNEFSGSLPSELSRLIMLEEMLLNNNEFTSTIPSTLKSLFNADVLSLNENKLEGEVPDVLCKLDPQPEIRADCRNDILQPDVKCTCCSYCTDLTPTWSGKCPDSTLKIVIDHLKDGDFFNSESLEWSITDTATNKQIIGDKYMRGLPLKPEYEMCIASTDCFSLNMKSEAIGSILDYPQFSSVGFETKYTIYWNDNLLLTDTFVSDMSKPFEQPEVLFQYNPAKNQAETVSSCVETEVICVDTPKHPTYQQRIYYKTALKISGTEAFNDVGSPHSRALCWIINNDGKFYQSTKYTAVIQQFTQRYVLTLLHLTSVSGIFGDDEFPPLSHECTWKGVTCDDGMNNKTTPLNQIIGKRNKMTSLILSSAANQIIGGTLIPEIGNLPFLEILFLNQTGLEGPIPDVFSNLYSLRELNLSENNLTGSIPDDFFDQLKRIELFDLSSNDMTGVIPARIGSNSNIITIRLNRNRFTGKLPLEGFTKFNLEQLDVSENQLSGSISPSLFEHKNLKSLAISSNFFAGSLLEHTFTSLEKLEFFDISQNDFSGIIPSQFPDLSNISHFDIHLNRFKGPIPLIVTELSKLQYLNLQGNYLTGSLPSQLNKLMNIDTLILSHNKLKGLIPFDPTALKRMRILHLHSNKLSGEAPTFNNLTSYITDCGFPSDSLEPVSCSTCNKCCNSDGVCQFKTSEKLSQVQLTAIFVLSIITFISMCYVMKDYITSIKYLKPFFSETVFFWNAMMLISDRSVYHFLLAKNKTGWFLAVCCVVFQTATLFLFVHSADMSNRISDRQYTMICPANSLTCEDSNKVSSYGLFVLGLILTIWLLRDIIGSIKLMLVSFQKRSIDFFFASAVIFTVTMLSIWTSVVYIIAIAIKNTDMIKDAVVLLFVVEVDERIFQLVESINPDWIEAIDDNMRSSMIYGGDDLVITTWAIKATNSMESMRKKIRNRYESFLERSSKESVKKEVKDKCDSNL